VVLRKLDPEILAAEPLGHGQGRPAPREGIEHQLARIARDANDPLQDRFGHLTGMGGLIAVGRLASLLEGAADAGDIPGVHGRLEVGGVFLRPQYPRVVGKLAEWVGAAIGIRSLPSGWDADRISVEGEALRIGYVVEDVCMAAVELPCAVDPERVVPDDPV